PLSIPSVQIEIVTFDSPKGIAGRMLAALSPSRWISRRALPLAATILVCALLYTVASIEFQGFFSGSVFIEFFSENAFLGIAALGTTFVILSGGIDLSVGSVV